MKAKIVLLIGCLWPFFSSADHFHTQGSGNALVPAAFYVPGKGFSSDRVKQFHPKQIADSAGIELLLMPAGEFVMGSKTGDEDEKELRKEQIKQPFYLSKYEVTQNQWKKIMGTQPWLARGNVQVGDRFPAVYVNWLEAREFITRLNKLERCSCYHLPTEVEWEYAARAGTVSTYSFGDNSKQLSEFAWYADSISDRRFARAVGEKEANPWGIYDMHGNVWEWVSDWRTEDMGPRIRGGSWGSPSSSLRSSNRSAAQVDRRASHIGFRVVRALD